MLLPSSLVFQEQQLQVVLLLMELHGVRVLIFYNVLQVSARQNSQFRRPYWKESSSFRFLRSVFKVIISHDVRVIPALWLNLAVFGVKVKFLSSFEM